MPTFLNFRAPNKDLSHCTGYLKRQRDDPPVTADIRRTVEDVGLETGGAVCIIERQNGVVVILAWMDI